MGKVNELTGQALSISGLTKVFDGHAAVNDLNFVLGRGTVCGLLGPNGAGKTTTFKLIMNLLVPGAGTISVLGHDAVKETVQVKQKVGYLAEMQHFYFRKMRVGEIIRLCKSFYARWDDTAVQRWQAIFGLPDETKITSLSKGKQTLLGLVLARGHDPEFYLLDEPFTGLDPARRRQVLSLLVEEMAGKERTILISSHQLHDLERVVDRVGFLHEGRLILFDAVENLFNREKKIRVAFSGLPPAEINTWPGVRRVIPEGKHFLIETCGTPDKITEKLDSLPGATYDVLDQTLEDIFLSYTGGNLDEQNQPGAF